MIGGPPAWLASALGLLVLSVEDSGPGVPSENRFVP